MQTVYALLRDEFIRFSGADALSFLQAMTTNDLSALAEPGHTRLTGFCSPQGRLLGLMQLSGESGTLYARVPRGMAGPLIEKLQPFVFRSQVDMQPVGDSWCVVGAAGPGLSGAMSDAGLPAPEKAGRSAGRAGLHIMGIRDDVMELALPVAGLEELQASLSRGGIEQSDSNDWEHQAITDGIPEIYPSTMDEFIPQMVNLDGIGGVSFDKGCYPGQEIVARIRSLGSVKRHMQLVRSDAEPAAAGTDISDGDGKSIGKIVRSAAGTDGAVMLAVIADSALDSELLLPDGVSVHVQKHQDSL